MFVSTSEPPYNYLLQVYGQICVFSALIMVWLRWERVE